MVQIKLNKTLQLSLLIIIVIILPRTTCAQIITPRIIGGFNVTSHEGFKHQVSIRDASYENYKFGSGHICGGSLIDYDTVIITKNFFSSI